MKMTITVLSYMFLVIAVVLGLIAVVLFFAWKLPKGYRAVKGQKRRKKQAYRTAGLSEKKPERAQTVKLEKKQQEKVPFIILQDITFVHAQEEQ